MSYRRSWSLVVVVLAGMLAVASAGGPAGAAGARCKAGKIAWKIQGRTVCVTKRSVAPQSALRQSTAPLAETALTEAVRTYPLNRRRRLPERLRRAIAHAIPRTVAAAAEVEGRVEQARAARGARGWAASAAPGPLTKTFTETQGGTRFDAEVTGRPDARGGGNLELSLGATDTKSGTSVKVAMDLPISREPDSRCPDADGKVTLRQQTGTKLTTIAKKGGRVISARTIDVRQTSSTVAQIGPDGQVQSTTTTFTEDLGAFERGVQLEQSSTITVAGAANGAVSITGTPTASTRLRAAEATRAQERAIERDLSAKSAGQKEPSKRAGEQAQQDRAALKSASEYWNRRDYNPCVKVVWTPADGSPLETGQSTGVVGKVVRQDNGAPVAGLWQIEAVITGTFTGGGAAPASGGTFFAVAGPRQGTGDTVAARVLVRSPAGSMVTSWSAKGADLPATMDATMKQTSTMSQGGLNSSETFTATARWTRRDVTYGGDGSRTVWYDVASATTSQYTYAFDVGGCGYAVDASGGTPVSGDVELRISPAGAVTYGFVVDIDLGHQQMHKTFGPPECPPAGNPQLKAIVQARRAPDSSLYDAPPGALQGTAFSASRQGVTDGIGTTGGQQQITIDWGLTGS